MLDAIIRFSINNKLTIGLMTAALVAWGVWSLNQLPIDAVPDITNNQVQVITSASSQSAQDIERLVTFPVEQTMATIPGIEEIRSFSRFGLSVVTIVFKEEVDVYWARQQVNERLAEAKNLIPDGVGSPELAPVTTGLGEIYQYILHPLPGYEQRYDLMELRSIQDWIIRRQLLGVEGVADVSSFGGYLKQYEIALNPVRMHAMNVSIEDVFAALDRNNQNTGGSYINRRPHAWYIRSEGLIQGLDDIRKIAIRRNPDGIPLLIEDVAEVQFGHAVRYGAMTEDDKGEVVGAVVMMLKGANSSKVIHQVKERIVQIQANLPEGLRIDPYLDRTKLVDKAIGTVVTNLTEGALIVIFILVLLLGNFRGGLVVASVIPLAMLFAIALMNLFGVSGNLMSLGAIDFGLIVDGAVIIVEGTLHHLQHQRSGDRLNQDEMDKEVMSSAKKIMQSAAFGEFIILIVYLPILALVGVEGKMFKPMAQTVSFAILGAFILSLTYVPMMSALLLSKHVKTKATISDRIINFLQKLYRPSLEAALKLPILVIGVAAGLLAGGLLLFNQLGAEFIPTLDEGDFAVETRLLQGSSIDETVAAVQQSAKVLKENYPEVNMVVGKIGSSEIPTDPMPVESADLIIMLKEKDEWKSATTRDELAEKMQATLEDHIPGVTYGFQQPIQMRFNELMSGARQDVVIKIYGEDLDTLAKYAELVGKLASTVEGARDLFVEPVTGLNQIVIRYDRDALARFDLDIFELNTAINAAFAGQFAGRVYEGERRFDLVLRLEEGSRQSIEDIRSLPVRSPNGELIPLRQLAKVDFEVGPSQIQRDDAKRRIIVGFNVRGRDVESVVNEMQAKVKQQVKFPAGYFETYGGTFKNLIEARERLMVAVPVALLLIWLLLYFSFRSVKQSLLIFSAIPLSAIGGVVALWTRDMPFSISAGVGFIALFGVAVLNGIVLIAEFNRLKANGMEDLKSIIMTGAKNRLRPVIMTAAVASLGFLPMAISQTEGAEVQRPLATVVIGGLITATLLTLIVLPCLYALSERKMGKGSQKAVAASLVLMLLSGIPSLQAQGFSQEQAIATAIRNNPGLRAAELQKRYAEMQAKTVSKLPRTDVSLTLGQFNSFEKRDNNISINQAIPFPSIFAAKSRLAREKVEASQLELELAQLQLKYHIQSIWLNVKALHSQKQWLSRQDSLYRSLLSAATLRYETGEGTLLEKSSAEAQRSRSQMALLNCQAEIAMQLLQLQGWMKVEDLPPFDDTLALELVPIPEAIAANSRQVAIVRQSAKIWQEEAKVIGLQRLPDFQLGYFNQSLIGMQTINGQDVYFGPNDRFQGISVGLSIPLWWKPEQAEKQSALLQADKAIAKAEQLQLEIEAAMNQRLMELGRSSAKLAWLQASGIPNAELIISQSSKAFQAGEIGYHHHLLNLQEASATHLEQIELLKTYHQALLEIEMLGF